MHRLLQVALALIAVAPIWGALQGALPSTSCHQDFYQDDGTDPGWGNFTCGERGNFPKIYQYDTLIENVPVLSTTLNLTLTGFNVAYMNSYNYGTEEKGFTTDLLMENYDNLTAFAQARMEFPAERVNVSMRLDLYGVRLAEDAFVTVTRF